MLGFDGLVVRGSGSGLGLGVRVGDRLGVRGYGKEGEGKEGYAGFGLGVRVRV